MGSAFHRSEVRLLGTVVVCARSVTHSLDIECDECAEKTVYLHYYVLFTSEEVFEIWDLYV